MGKISDANALRPFFEKIDLCVFENEFVPSELIESVAQGVAAPIAFLPLPSVLHRFRNKLRQKELLEKLSISYSAYLAFDGQSEDALEQWCTSSLEHFGGEAVFKWAEQGYDGKGTLLTRSCDEAFNFCNLAMGKGISVFAEERVHFKRELAIIGCYSTRGQFISYPLVISEQEKGICKRVVGPATSLGVPTLLEKTAQTAAEKVAREENLYGSFAIEFFETADGRLVVNELAPRVHNSGHYSMDASETSQFENHWRAVLGQELGSTMSAPLFAMLNLLGPKDLTLRVSQSPQLKLSSDLRFHWYDKEEIKPGRKLGHINATLKSLPADQVRGSQFEALVQSTFEKLNGAEQEWIQKLRGDQPS